MTVLVRQPNAPILESIDTLPIQTFYEGKRGRAEGSKPE